MNWLNLAQLKGEETKDFNHAISVWLYCVPSLLFLMLGLQILISISLQESCPRWALPIYSHKGFK